MTPGELLHEARAWARWNLAPDELWGQCRHRWQRARRGWSDRDCWSADWYWTRTIVAMLERLAEWRTGRPPHPTRTIDRGTWQEPDALTDAEWWDGIVAFIIRAMRQQIALEDNYWRYAGITEVDRAAIEEDWRAALALLAEWWFAFWD